jgi:benzoate/toluate 1,2-dioxygenase reductase subunit
MEKELEVGRPVWVKLPYGDFVVSATQPSVLFAGGTGITAFTAFVAGLKPNLEQPVFLAYGARSPELLIYRDMLERQAATVRGFSLSLFSEQSATGTQEGRLSLAHIWPLVEELPEADCYLSGPPQMVAALSADLRQRGVSAERIRIDAWE